SHFGVDRPEWAGASGARLLGEAARRVREAGFRIGNVSVQVIGNRPRLSRRREEACAAMSEAAGAAVTVSGSTTDALGLTGRGDGVAAMATALVLAGAGPGEEAACPRPRRPWTFRCAAPTSRPPPSASPRG